MNTTSELTEMNERPSKMSLVAGALTQLAFSAFVGGFIATNILLFITIKDHDDIPAQADTITYLTYGAIIAVVLLFTRVFVFAKKQKKAYIAAGGDHTAHLTYFMFGDMGGEMDADGTWKTRTPVLH